MAYGVSKRKLNLGATKTDAIFLLLFNSLTSQLMKINVYPLPLLGAVLWFHVCYRKFKMSVSKLGDAILILLC